MTLIPGRIIRYLVVPAAALALAMNAGCGNDQIATAGDLLADLVNDIPPSSANAICGPNSIAAIVPDCPLNLVCFTSACAVHNDCYGTCGSDRITCDSTFFLDLLGICGQRVFLDREDAELCRSLAFAYWLAVASFGEEAYRQTQLAACSDSTIPPFAPGVCCTDGETCFDEGNRFECDDEGGVFVPFATCDNLSCAGPANDECAEAVLVCDEPDPKPDRGTCAGDPDEPCFPSAPACSDGSECVRAPIEGYECVASTDNRLATTDGPDVDGDCLVSGNNSFQADVWYELVAPCNGRMVVRMCSLETYDSMLAVYGNGDPSGACACPGDGAPLLECNDDFCGGASTSAVFVEDVVADACYVVRVGGWSRDGSVEQAGQDVGELDITFRCEATPATDTPESADEPSAPEPSAAGPAQSGQAATGQTDAGVDTNGSGRVRPVRTRGDAAQPSSKPGVKSHSR